MAAAGIAAIGTGGEDGESYPLRSLVASLLLRVLRALPPRLVGVLPLNASRPMSIVGLPDRVPLTWRRPSANPKAAWAAARPRLLG